MSSIGQAVGGVVGAVIGFTVGGPSGALYGAQIGMTAGGLIDPPKGPHINGPRLSDLSVQTSTYGAFIPRDYGTVAQSGNVFWVQGDKLIEIAATTSSGGKGGPRSTQTNYSYYASFAVGLCEGPISGVRRIWIGPDLYYDAGSSNVSDIIASNQAAATFTLYTGTDTQNPDPLIQADKGTANVPAYRGLAYIVFDMLPLEKYGNSLAGAIVKVEVVKNSTDTTSLQVVDTYSQSAYPISNDYDGRYVYTCNSSYIDVFDAVNPAAIRKTATFSMPAYDIAVSGGYGYVVGFSDSLKIIDPVSGVVIGTGTVAFKNFSAVAVSGNYAYCSSVGWIHVFDIFDKTAPVASPTRYAGGYYTMAISGGYLYSVDSSGLYIYDIDTSPGNPVFKGSISAAYSRDVAISGSYAYVACAGVGAGYFMIFDVSNPASPALISSTSNGDPLMAVAIEGDYAYLAGLNSATLYVYDITDPASPAVVASHTAGTNMRGVVKADDYVLTMDDTAPLRSWVFSGLVVSPNQVLLSDIVSDECLKSRLLTASDIDVTALTDSVRGYRVSQLGAIRSGLDPLRAAWPFDVVQHGYKIRFVRRGGASVATVTAGELDARGAGDAMGVSISDDREMDTVLPRKVTIKYLDATREYDINEQFSERSNTDAVNEQVSDLPIVFSATEAAEKAETLLYLYWLERNLVALTLPPGYAALEPADVITVTADMGTFELRLISVQYLPDGRLQCQARYNHAAIYTPSAQGEEGQSTGGALALSGATAYALLDIPLMRTADDMPGFPVAMAGYLSGWPGGILYRSDDSGQTWTDVDAWSTPATLGFAVNALAAHGGTVYDFSGSLTVKLFSGTLSSVTESQLFAGQNWFAYGRDGRWEIIAARSAVLQVDGSYVLSDLLRGQHGTEWASGLHAASDTIVLLDAAALKFVSVNSSTIGISRLWRGVTLGKPLSSDTDLSYAYNAVNLECLSPVALTGNRHPSTNDWTLAWTRRSRYADWRDYIDAPLAEASESYEIDIFSGGTYSTLKRTLTASSPTVAYTSAQQVTDFGSNQTTLYLKIYQISAIVGRGYPLTQSITR